MSTISDAPQGADLYKARDYLTAYSRANPGELAPLFYLELIERPKEYKEFFANNSQGDHPLLLTKSQYRILKRVAENPLHSRRNFFQGAAMMVAGMGMTVAGALESVEAEQMAKGAKVWLNSADIDEKKVASDEEERQKAAKVMGEDKAGEMIHQWVDAQSSEKKGKSAAVFGVALCVYGIGQVLYDISEANKEDNQADLTRKTLHKESADYLDTWMKNLEAPLRAALKQQKSLGK
jgi:hypothetical protein